MIKSYSQQKMSTKLNLFIENVVNMKDMKYKNESDLKPAKYKKVKIFKSGWDNIVLPKPPTPDSKEAKEQMMKTVSEVKDATDKEKQEYIHTDIEHIDSCI